MTGRIGRKEEVHDTLAGAAADWFKRPGKNLRRRRHLTRFAENGRDPEDIIWALKDVSFEVKRGEVVGIPSILLRPALNNAEVAGIGRNDADKSTALRSLKFWLKSQNRISF